MSKVPSRIVRPTIEADMASSKFEQLGKSLTTLAETLNSASLGEQIANSLQSIEDERRKRFERMLGHTSEMLRAINNDSYEELRTKIELPNSLAKLLLEKSRSQADKLITEMGETSRSQAQQLLTALDNTAVRLQDVRKSPLFTALTEVEETYQNEARELLKKIDGVREEFRSAPRRSWRRYLMLLSEPKESYALSYSLTPEIRREQINLRVSATVKSEMQKAAAKQRKTLSNFIVEVALEEATKINFDPELQLKQIQELWKTRGYKLEGTFEKVDSDD